MNKPKAKGTKRETALVNAHHDKGLQTCRRDANNSASSDVILTLRDMKVRYEVKDRQNLNAHKVMADMQARYPDSLNVVYWHRTSRKGDNTRLSPDGPALVHLTLDDWLEILAELNHWSPS